MNLLRYSIGRIWQRILFALKGESSIFSFFPNVPLLNLDIYITRTFKQKKYFFCKYDTRKSYKSKDKLLAAFGSICYSCTICRFKHYSMFSLSSNDASMLIYKKRSLKKMK